MFSPTVELTKDAIVLHLGDQTEPYELSELGDLLHLWHWRLEGIDPEFTVGDLAHLLQGVSEIDALSCLVNVPVGAILEYGGGEAAMAEFPLRYVEVCNVAAPTRYVPDPEKPDVPPRVIGEDGEPLAEPPDAVPGPGSGGAVVGFSSPDAITGKVAVHRVIAPERHGSWHGPYHIERRFQGWGMQFWPPVADAAAEPGERGYDLFFAVLPEIAHLPLRYNPELMLGLAADGTAARRQVTITVGELLHSVFWGLGFNGPPEDRIAMRSALSERFDGLDGGGDGLGPGTG